MFGMVPHLALGHQMTISNCEIMIAQIAIDFHHCCFIKRPIADRINKPTAMNQMTPDIDWMEPESGINIYSERP